MPLETKSLVTYTGTDDVFDPTWSGLSVEFVAFRCHRNPPTYPAAGTPNGNYWPSLLTSRYSIVTDVIDGKNLKVNFVYNGGNIASPVPTTGASGYFFLNNQAAFQAALAANSSVLLHDNETYVIKGGFGFTPTQNTRISAVNSANIKLSLEDAFTINEAGTFTEYTTANSYADTYGTYQMFRRPLDATVNMIVENVNILPPHYNVKCSEYGRDYLDPFFLNQDDRDYDILANFTAGVQTLSNSNSRLEADMVGAPPDATFCMPEFAACNNGGKVNLAGTDISEYLEFNLINSKYYATQIHGVKVNKRCGVKMSVIGTVGSPTEAIAFDGTSKAKFTTVSACVKDDGSGNIRLVNILSSDCTTYQLANEYWSGFQSAKLVGYLNARRMQYIKVSTIVDTYNLYIANAGSFKDEALPTDHGIPIIIQDGSNFLMYEQVPVGPSNPYGFTQTNITIDGTVNTKVSNTVFNIKGWALQALTTYPYLLDWENPSSYNAAEGFYTNAASDQLEWFNGSTWVTINILNRYRMSEYAAPLISTAYLRPYWQIELDTAVTDANPVFRVKTSQTESILNPSGIITDFVFYVMGNANQDSDSGVVDNYWQYGSENLNIDWQNCILHGLYRFEDKLGTGPLSPLYKLPVLRNFLNVDWTDYDISYSPYYANGLYWRNVNMGVGTYVNTTKGGTMGIPGSLPADNNSIVIVP